MKSFQTILSNMCFSTEIHSKLVSEINENMDPDDFVRIIRTVDDCFNGCYKCGCDLEEYDYDYMTSHGICYECSLKLKDDEE